MTENNLDFEYKYSLTDQSVEIKERIKLSMGRRLQELIGGINDELTRLSWKFNVLQDLAVIECADKCFIHYDKTNNTSIIIDNNGFIGEVLYVDDNGKRTMLSVSVGRNQEIFH
jgi:hypothetical protein